jgi:hypothetical protein
MGRRVTCAFCYRQTINRLLLVFLTFLSPSPLPTITVAVSNERQQAATPVSTAVGSRRLNDDSWHSVYMKRREHLFHVAVDDSSRQQATGNVTA